MAVQKTVFKEGSNEGRQFWCCPNHESARCKFFEWDDEPPWNEMLEDYDPSRSPVSYDVVYLPFVYIWCDVWLGSMSPHGLIPPSRQVPFLHETGARRGSSSGVFGGGSRIQHGPIIGVRRGGFRCGEVGHWSNGECPSLKVVRTVIDLNIL